MTPMICLAAAIFFEARDQPLDGMRAVGEVVMNRVESDRWPDDVCRVVYQNKQFSFTHDGKSDNYRKYNSNVGDREAGRIAEMLSKQILNGDRLGLTSTHYHASYVAPYWRSFYHYDGMVGDHLFYTAKKGK